MSRFRARYVGITIETSNDDVETNVSGLNSGLTRRFGRGVTPFSFFAHEEEDARSCVLSESNRTTYVDWSYWQVVWLGLFGSV